MCGDEILGKISKDLYLFTFFGLNMNYDKPRLFYMFFTNHVIKMKIVKKFKNL